MPVIVVVFSAYRYCHDVPEEWLQISVRFSASMPWLTMRVRGPRHALLAQTQNLVARIEARIDQRARRKAKPHEEISRDASGE